MAGEYLTPTPYANPLTGLSNDMIQGLLEYMKDKQRTQQMQGLAGLLESTGIPKTVERAAYADSPKALLDALTNVNRANVPLLKPETADAIMNIAPLVGPAAKAAERGAMAAGRAGERYAEKVVPQIMERGGIPAQLLGDLSQGSVRKMSNEVSNMPLRTFRTSDGYTLYELKNGKIVDNLDPEGVDMSWDNFKQLKDDFGDDVYQVEDELGKRRSAISSTGNPNLLDDWYAFRAEPTKDELYQQALNKQNAPKSNVVEFPKTNLLETAEPSFVYSQEEAMRLAQQRAALPVSEGGLGLKPDNTAAERAKAMGYEDVYHGTTQGREREGFSNTKNVWATDNPKVANTYATNRPDWGAANGKAVMPLSVRMENPMVLDARGQSWQSVPAVMPNEGGDELFYTTDKLAQLARKYGNDSLVVNNVFDVGSGRIPTSQKGTDALTGTTYAIFNPENIRSQFAAFEPFRKTAAIAATMGVAAPDLLAEETKPKKKRKNLLD